MCGGRCGGAPPARAELTGIAPTCERKSGHRRSRHCNGSRLSSYVATERPVRGMCATAHPCPTGAPPPDSFRRSSLVLYASSVTSQGHVLSATGRSELRLVSELGHDRSLALRRSLDTGAATAVSGRQGPR